MADCSPAKDLAGTAERLLYRRLYAGGRNGRTFIGYRAGLYAVDLLYERLLPAVLGNCGATPRYLRLHWKKGCSAGLEPWARMAALWAMTQAPLAVVAALRETSILFGALIAFVLLKEKVAGLRIAAALGIAAGAILLRLA